MTGTLGGRGRRLLAVAAGLLLTALLLAGCGGGSSGGSSGSSSGGSQGRAGPSPSASQVLLWPAPQDASAAAKRAGLPVYGEEKLEVHYHAHLDVYVDGRHVLVPAGIGIDERRQRISPLHTHDTSGVVHVEAPKPRPFTLGQVFTEWGVPFSASRLGQFHASPGHPLAVYVNGEKATGDPGKVRLAPHQEIAVVYGKAPTPLPTSYDFPPGL